MRCARIASASATASTDSGVVGIGWFTGVRIGTCGWQCAHWREVLYPRGLPQFAWLRRYAEVDVTGNAVRNALGLAARLRSG
jgi:hypothetical protein